MRAGAPRGAVILAALAILSAPAARADMVYELGPALSAGWTSNAVNAASNSSGRSDEFGTLSLAGRVRYRGQRSEQALGYRLGATRYLHLTTLDTLTQELAWLSTYNLTSRLDLGLGAAAALSHSTAYTLGDAGTVVPQAGAAGDLQYVTASVIQTLTYSPTARRKYFQSLQASHISYLSAPTPLPDTTFFGGTLRAAWEQARDTTSITGSVTDSIARVPEGGPPQLAGHRLFGQLLAGWRREFSQTWSGEANVGGVMVIDTGFNGVIAPAGNANLSYRQLFWFATLSVSQSASPNIFIGNATLNDQAILRLTLPLTRSQLLFVSGYASYAYARIADESHHDKAYDLISLGAALTARSETLPLWGSIDYGFTDQHGGVLRGGGLIPSLSRHVILLTVGGAFAFGKGTPPIFHGVL